MKTKSGVFSFEGRIGIEEYWGNVAVSVIIGIGISLMANTRLACFASLLLPCYLWYVLAFMSKRCHDRGNSGAFILIPFYPLVLAFGEGDVGANEYGPNPNDKDSPAVVGGWLFAGGVVAVLGGVVAVLGAYIARMIAQSKMDQMVGLRYGVAYGSHQIDSSGYYAFTYVAGAIALLGLGLIIAGLSRSK